MAALIGLIAIACSLASLVCWIIVLISMFKQEESVLHGIIGIICGLYAFIWGWSKWQSPKKGLVMGIWTAAFIGSILVNVAAGAMQ